MTTPTNNSIHFFHNHSADRVGVSTPVEFAIDRAALTRAQAAINNYLLFLKNQRLLNHLSIDAFVGNCLALPDVVKFIEQHGENEYAARRLMRQHISSVIKTYIDSKE
jgi:hypothetical protein